MVLIFRSSSLAAGIFHPDVSIFRRSFAGGGGVSEEEHEIAAW
jgi:hypothetical protein